MDSQVKQGYKQTELGVIPEDWDISTIEELCDISSGTTPSRSLMERYYKNGSINWVKTLDLNNSNIKTTEELVTENALKETCLRCFPIGTVLVAMYGGFNQIGRTGLLRIPATVNQAITAIKPNLNRLNSDYLLRNLNYHVDYWKSVASSSRKDPNITSKDIKKYSLLVPPIAEQEKIAEALSDVDSLIESLEELITKKRQIKQGAMQELLTGKRRLINNGQWKLEKLGKIANIVRGASPRPIDSPIWFDKNSRIGWVRISDVTKSGMTLKETTQYLSELGVKSSRFVESGSLIMSICATVGRPIITELDVCIHDGFVVFESLQADKIFIYYVLQSIEQKWSQHGQTGSQMNLNTNLINQTKVLLPPKAEQEAIAEVLTDMDNEITVLEEKLQKTRHLKQGMMQELLTGKTRLI